jgi:hypothetical protein
MHGGMLAHLLAKKKEFHGAQQQQYHLVIPQRYEFSIWTPG